MSQEKFNEMYIRARHETIFQDWQQSLGVMAGFLLLSIVVAIALQWRVNKKGKK